MSAAVSLSFSALPFKRFVFVGLRCDFAFAKGRIDEAQPFSSLKYSWGRCKCGTHAKSCLGRKQGVSSELFPSADDHRYCSVIWAQGCGRTTETRYARASWCSLLCRWRVPHPRRGITCQFPSLGPQDRQPMRSPKLVVFVIWFSCQPQVFSSRDTGSTGGLRLIGWRR